MHVYRGENWYLLFDELSGEHLRLNAKAYALVGRLDGKCTLGTIFNYLRETDVNAIETAEAVDIVSRLHWMGAISNVLDKETIDLVKQYRDRRRSIRLRKLISPLLIRIPLLDPNKLLVRITPWCAPLFGRTALGIWLVVVMFGVLCGIQNASLLTSEISSDVLKPSNLLLMWLIYPFMKLLHEFAHAVAIKRWGGDVHEMGITLLVLTPIPYLDASAATAFKSKYKRIVVSAAGIMAELFLAAIALFIWLSASEGIVRDCAFSVFMIGAVATVLFNANPLLKFDGYFILQDLIEVPNLMTRSAHYYRYAIKKYIMKLSSAVSPVTAVGERKWFIVYGALSSVYKLVVMYIIVVFLSQRFLLLGVALACWAVIQQLLLPFIKAVKYLWCGEETAHQRRYSRGLLVAGGATAVLLVAVVPMPSATHAQGVVWVPQQGELFAEAGGQVSRVAVKPGDKVVKGQLLLELTSPELEKTIIVMENERIALDIKSELLRSINPTEYALLQQDIAALDRSLAEQKNKANLLSVVARTDGTFTPSADYALFGRYFQQGDLIAHVVNPTELVVRVAVPDADSGRIRNGIRSASVKLAEALGRSIRAEVINEVPAADNRLPSAALGAGGGGGIAIASSDEQGLTTIDSVFHLQLGLPANTKIFGVGERAYVTLRHRAEPIGKRWVRTLQQVFLKTLPA